MERTTDHRKPPPGRSRESQKITSATGQPAWLQPAPQELRRQPLQVTRQQREAVGDEQKTEKNEEGSRDPVHPHEVGPEPLEPGQKAVQGKRGDDKRNRQTYRVRGEQHRAVADALPCRGEGEDRPQDRSDAWGPGGAEGDPYDGGPEVAQGLPGELDLALGQQPGGTRHAQQVEAEQDHQHPSRPADPDLRVPGETPQGRGRRTEDHKDHGEPSDEPQRVQQRGAAPPLELLRREAGEEAEVARDQGEDARRQEAQQSRRECDGEANGAGPYPQNATADTTVVQRPSSPHSAVEVTFIVRTMSPDRSHCSRRSSHALSGSNGTPSTVPSIEAARSSAYSPAATSFCP